MWQCYQQRHRWQNEWNTKTKKMELVLLNNTRRMLEELAAILIINAAAKWEDNWLWCWLRKQHETGDMEKFMKWEVAVM